MNQGSATKSTGKLFISGGDVKTINHNVVMEVGSRRDLLPWGSNRDGQDAS
jgi:hypothetical protein